MAANALRNRPPLGLVRDFSVEGGGEHKGTIDLKVNGSTIFVDAARIFALASAVTATSTAARLRASAVKLKVPPEEIEAWVAAFHHILDLRLHGQERPGGGAVAANRVDPEALNPLERTILKESLRQARGIQGRLALDYGV
jgi:CBS domain-containing protein